MGRQIQQKNVLEWEERLSDIWQCLRIPFYHVDFGDDKQIE